MISRTFSTETNGGGTGVGVGVGVGVGEETGVTPMVTVTALLVAGGAAASGPFAVTSYLSVSEPVNPGVGV